LPDAKRLLELHLQRVKVPIVHGLSQTCCLDDTVDPFARSPARIAFILIELLVVIAIIAILAACALSSLITTNIKD